MAQASIPDRDPVAKSFSVAYLSWKPDIRYPSASEVAELDVAAEQVISGYLDAAATHLPIYYDPPWYRGPADVWCDDVRWRAILGERLGRQGRYVGGLEMALRVDRCRSHVEAARAILDEWLDQGGQDYEHYLDLIAAVFPDHDRSVSYLDPDGFEWRRFSPAVAATGYRPLLASAGEQVATWDYGEDLLAAMGHANAVEFVPEAAREKVHQELLEVCRTTLGGSDGLYAEEVPLWGRHDRAAKCAAAVGWDDVLRALERNPEYLHQLFLGCSEVFAQWAEGPRKGAEFIYQALFSDWATDVLAWSWALPGDSFTGRIAAAALRLSGQDAMHFVWREQTKQEAGLSAAIAWKRHRQAAG